MRGMARVPIFVEGLRGSRYYMALVDTGSTHVVLPEADCEELGLIDTGRLAHLRTVAGMVAAKVYVASRMAVEGDKFKVENIEVIAKTVPGIAAILGVNFFLKRFDFHSLQKNGLFLLE